MASTLTKPIIELVERLDELEREAAALRTTVDLQSEEIVKLRAEIVARESLESVRGGMFE